MFSLAGGGAERTVVNIINNMDKSKFEVILVLGSKNNNKYLDLISKDVNIKILNCTKVKYCVFKLRNSIINENPDFVFSTLNPNNIVLSLANMICFSRKSRVTIREANHRTQSGKVKLVNKILTYLTYNYLVENVVALSQGVKEDLVNNFKISSRKIKVIYNPIEVDMIQSLSKEAVCKNISNNKERTIIAVGRLVEQKDFNTLINAFSIVEKKIPSKLIILGTGPLEMELKKYSEYLGVSKSIRFLGFKKNPYKYIYNSDLFVLSSKWEGFGHVIVESMACGTPVISSNCKSGPKEIIGDNEYGVLSKVGDVGELAESIIELLRNNDVLDNYSKKGLQRATDFKAIKIVDQYQKLFT